MFSSVGRRGLWGQTSGAQPSSAVSLAPPVTVSPAPSSPQQRKCEGPARVVVLLHGEQVKFNSALTSDGAVTAMMLHERVRRYISAKSGRDCKSISMLFGDQAVLEGDMGSESARTFIKSFNTTEGYPSMFVDVGPCEGTGAETLLTHVTLHSDSSDFLILGVTESTSETLIKHLKELSTQFGAGQVVLVALGEHDEKLARELGLNTMSFGDALVSRMIESSSNDASGPVVHPVLGPIVAELGDNVKTPVSAHISPVQQLEASIAHDSASFESISSPETSPRSDHRIASDGAEGVQDLSATIPFLTDAPPEPVDPRSFAEVMKSRPATFAKPKSTHRSRSARQQPPADFQPLFAAIRSSYSRGFSHPLRSQVGAEIRQNEGGREAVERYGGFKKYVEEAARQGLVVLGEAATPGREWVQLAG